MDWELQEPATLEQVQNFFFGVVVRTRDGKRMIGDIDPFDLMDGPSVRQSGTMTIDLREDWHNAGPASLVPTVPSHGGFQSQPGFGRPGFPLAGRPNSEPEMMEVTIVHSVGTPMPVPVSNMIKIGVTAVGQMSPESDMRLPFQIAR